MKKLLVFLVLATLVSCGDTNPGGTPGGGGGTKTPAEIQIERKASKIREVIAKMEEALGGGSAAAALSAVSESEFSDIYSKSFTIGSGNDTTIIRFVKIDTERTEGDWIVVSAYDLYHHEYVFRSINIADISSSDLASILAGTLETPPQGWQVTYNRVIGVAGSGNDGDSYSSIPSDIHNRRFQGFFLEDWAGNEVDISGPKWIFSQDTDSSKNLEAMGAKIEALEVAEMEDTLINYGLSTERSQKLGKLMVSYKKVKTKRGLTSREKDVFTKELTGMTFKKASETLVQEGYDALVEKASDINGIDPEAVKELLNEVM